MSLLHKKIAGVHENASTQINVPKSVAEQIIRIGRELIPDEHLAGEGRVEQPHVTVKYGIDPKEQVLRQTLAGHAAFVVQLGKVIVFTNSDNNAGGTPVVIEVHGDALAELHQVVMDAIGTLPDELPYTPHITVAYVKPEEAQHYAGDDAFGGIEFEAAAVALSPYDDSKQVEIPLAKVAATDLATLTFEIEDGEESWSVKAWTADRLPNPYSPKERPVGYLDVQDDGSDAVWVFDVNVEDDWRGTGLGQKLYDRAIAEAKRRGKKVFDSSSDQTPEARAAWKRISQRYPVEQKHDPQTNEVHYSLKLAAAAPVMPEIPQVAPEMEQIEEEPEQEQEEEVQRDEPATEPKPQPKKQPKNKLLEDHGNVMHYMPEGPTKQQMIEASDSDLDLPTRYAVRQLGLLRYKMNPEYRETTHFVELPPPNKLTEPQKAFMRDLIKEVRANEGQSITFERHEGKQGFVTYDGTQMLSDVWALINGQRGGRPKGAAVPDVQELEHGVSKDYDRVRWVYQQFYDNKIQSMSWNDFQKQFPKEQNSPLFTQVRQNRPNITMDDMDRWMEEYNTKAKEYQNYELEHDTYQNKDTSFRDVEQLVLRINQSASAVEIIGEDEMMKFFLGQVAQGSVQSGHPVGKNTVGWLRVDFIDDNWLLIDEVQSDLINGIDLAKRFLTEPTLETLMNGYRSETVKQKIRDMGATEQMFQHSKREFARRGYTIEKLDEMRAGLVNLFKDWAEYGVASLIEIARRHGIKNVAIHTGQSIANRDPDLEADKAGRYYDQIAKAFGFKKQPLDVGDLKGEFWVRTATLKPSPTAHKTASVKILTRDQAIALERQTNQSGKHKEVKDWEPSYGHMPEGDYVLSSLPLTSLHYVDQDPDRQEFYAGVGGDLPPVLVHYTEQTAKRRGKQAIVMNGNHRCMAAEMRGDREIAVLMPEADYQRFQSISKTAGKRDEAVTSMTVGVDDPEFPSPLLIRWEQGMRWRQVLKAVKSIVNDVAGRRVAWRDIHIWASLWTSQQEQQEGWPDERVKNSYVMYDILHNGSFVSVGKPTATALGAEVEEVKDASHKETPLSDTTFNTPSLGTESNAYANMPEKVRGDEELPALETLAPQLFKESANEEYADFNALAAAQRGAPESAMLKIQHSPLAAGVYSFLVEHVGDLTHRMSEETATKWETFGYEFVKPKVERCLRMLENPYGFEREVEQNRERNFEYHEERGRLSTSFDQEVAKLKALGKAYADAHAKLPTHNHMQDLAKDAAVAIGLEDFDTCRRCLHELDEVLKAGPKAWAREAGTTRATKSAALQGVTYRVDVLDSSKGELICMANAYLNGERIGSVNFNQVDADIDTSDTNYYEEKTDEYNARYWERRQELPKELWVKYVWVEPKYRREGIATGMYEAMKAEFPGAKITSSSTTDDGSKFRNKLKERGVLAFKSALLQKKAVHDAKQVQHTDHQAIGLTKTLKSNPFSEELEILHESLGQEPPEPNPMPEANRVEGQPPAKGEDKVTQTRTGANLLAKNFKPDNRDTVSGQVYLLHFDIDEHEKIAPEREDASKPFHARHYLGWAEDAQARIQQHYEGDGAKLTQALKRKGITFTVARVWDNVDRNFERRVKSQGGLSRWCPICHKLGLIPESRFRAPAQEKVKSVPRKFTPQAAEIAEQNPQVPTKEPWEMKRDEYAPRPKIVKDEKGQDIYEEETDEQMTERYRKSRNWEQDSLSAMSLGKMTPEQAKERGYWTDVDNPTSFKPLPQKLYHVTTSASAIYSEGLRTRHELAMDKGGTGLGGGTDKAISFTTDLITASGIYRAIIEAIRVLNGKITVEKLIEMAEKGEGAERPWINELINWGGSHFVSYSENDPKRWTPGKPYDIHHQTFFEGKKIVQPGLGTADEDMPNAEPIGEGWMGGDGRRYHTTFKVPMTPEERQDTTFDFFKTWLATRENAGGHLNPLFFSSNITALAATPEDEVAILEFQPVPGAKGTQESALGEWRVYSGKAVQFVGTVPPNVKISKQAAYQVAYQVVGD